MLADEGVLRHAILERYKNVVAARGGDAAKAAKDSVVQECLEKIFVAHLRLPPLGDEEFAEVMERFAKQTNLRERDQNVYERSQLKVRKREALKTRQSEEVKVQVKAIQNQIAAREQEAARALTTIEPWKALPVFSKPDGARDYLFTDEDIEALTSKEIRDILHGNGQTAGPRAIQSFLLKCQLARVLLAKRGVDFVDVSSIARGLARACAGMAPDAHAPAGEHAKLIAEVVRELSWTQP
jgi:hypothetical protein